MDRLIGSVQQEIFSRFGLLSAIALPVMIPMKFCSVSVTPSDFASCFNGLEGAFQITGATYGLNESSLYLSAKLDEPGVRIWNLLYERLKKLKSSEGVEPFKPFIGFYLAQEESSVSLEEVVKALGEPPKVRFSSFTYTLIRLELDEPAESWYRDVFWEVEQLVKVRKSRAV
jgi:hypothetical protein